MILSFLNKASTERPLLFALLIPVLAINIWCGITTLKLVSQRTVIKEDYAHVNSIRNGLLSVDVWKEHIRTIVGDRITNLKFSKEQEAALKIEIENLLKALLTKADAMMHEHQKTFREKVRKLAFKTFVNVPELNKQAPEFAQSIIDEIQKPENLEKLKTLALDQLDNYAEKTHDNTAQGSSLQEVLAKYNSKNAEEFNSNAEKQIKTLHNKIRINTGVMIGSLFLFLLTWWSVRKNQGLHKPLYALSVALAFILLIASLSLPMIDIDARVKNVDFLLLGEHLHFSDQLLYYRSKSIMQMVKILIVSGKPDSVLVGLLLLIFSILFPISKLISTLFSLFSSEKFKNNKLVHFFAYNSGKWSMADVMVVAIFMAYIGFNGILNDQLKGLNLKLQSWQLIATNETSLQPGFILFVSFVLFGLVLSEILKRIIPTPLTAKEVTSPPLN